MGSANIFRLLSFFSIITQRINQKYLYLISCNINENSEMYSCRFIRLNYGTCGDTSKPNPSSLNTYIKRCFEWMVRKYQ